MPIRILSLIGLLIFGVHTVAAQIVTPPDDMRQAHFNAFSALDLSETTTGFLANRSAYLIDYSPYDGSTSAPALNGPTWEMVYFQLRDAALDPQGLPTSDDLKAEAEQHIASGTVPLALVWHRYDFIDSTAFQDNRMSVQNRRYVRPVAQRGQYANPASPYLTRTLFAAAALAGDFRERPHVGSSATFILDSDLTVVEAGATLSQVAVNFGDGQGYRTHGLRRGVCPG